MRSCWKRIAGVLLAAACCALFTLPNAPCLKAAAAGSPGEISAESAVLISFDTGTVLYEKNAREKRSMASTTKIMTALLALEEAERNGDRTVHVTEEMVRVEGSSMGLKAGDELTLLNLCAGMMLASGNDAANTVALTLADTQEEFAELMNLRARELSLNDTHFVTPSGLDDEAHYSTAYDMAQLARAALKNENFLKIVSCSTMQVEFSQPEKRVSYTNHNKLLRLYDGCIGVKTGFTKKSGRCLVSAARRDGVAFIAVTLNAPDDWNDHIALLDYGFSTVEAVSLDGQDFTAEVPVAGGLQETVSVRGGAGGTVSLAHEEAKNLKRTVLLPKFCYAPVQAGDQVGELQFTLGGAPVYTVPIYAEEAVSAYVPEPSFWEKIFKQRKNHGS